MDATCRELLRAWRRDPTDAVAADACAAALHRARVELPWELIPALSRWRQPLGLVARFAAQPPAEADGWPEAELLTAEARLGFRLPAALREWYRIAARWPGSVELGRRTVAPPNLRLSDGHLVVQRDTRPGVHQWLAVRDRDLAREDPTLVIEGDWIGPGAGRRLSAIFGGNVVSEVATSGPWAPGVRTGTIFTSVDMRGLVRRGFRALVRGEGFSHLRIHVHGDDELILVLHDGSRVEVRAATSAAWARVHAALADVTR